ARAGHAPAPPSFGSRLARSARDMRDGRACLVARRAGTVLAYARSPWMTTEDCMRSHGAVRREASFGRLATRLRRATARRSHGRAPATPTRGRAQAMPT